MYDEDFSINIVFENQSKIALPIPLNLKNYEVSVVNLQFPDAYYNVLASPIEYRSSSDKKMVTIPTGFYPSNEALIGEINRQISTEVIEITYDTVRQAAVVNIKSPRASIKFSKFLAHALRLPYTTLKTNAESSKPIELPVKEPFVVIANFVKPSLLNNSYSDVLYVGGMNGKLVNNYFTKTKEDIFQFLQVNIVDINMKPVTFISGKTTLTLHFRKVHK